MSASRGTVVNTKEAMSDAIDNTATDFMNF